jgi:tRNA threonylcarbamoyladenosine modification (KEOPS) complex  Pcc1 subunit
LETEIEIQYRSHKLAKSIMQALAPDNEMKASGMKIRAATRGKVLRISVRDCNRIETLQATVQDIFRCIRAAESSIGKIT